MNRGEKKNNGPNNNQRSFDDDCAVDSDDEVRTTFGEVKCLKEKLPSEGHEFKPFHVATLVTNVKDAVVRRFDRVFLKLNRMETSIDGLKAKQGLPSPRQRRRSSGGVQFNPLVSKKGHDRHPNEAILPPEVKPTRIPCKPWMVRNKALILIVVEAIRAAVFFSYYEPTVVPDVIKMTVRVTNAVLTLLLLAVALLI